MGREHQQDEMLEPYAGKLARTVLRGGSGSNPVPLPDISPACEEPLRDYLAMRKAAGLDPCRPESPLFASLSNKSMGRPLSTRSLRQIVKAALRRAGIDDSRITTHSLRHTAVTLALLGGASIQQAQAMARHTNINTTLIYSHALDRVAQAPEFLIDRMLDE